MTFVITYAAPGWANDDILVVRFTASGDVDTTFDPPNGFLTYDGGFDDYNWGVAIQTDGKIVVAGESGNGVDSDLLVLRYNADGSLDGGFGTGGVVTYDSGRGDAGLALTIQSDGKIVVAGGSNNGTDHDVLVLRYNADGSLDGGFGAGGVVTRDCGPYAFGWAVAIQSDGKIVVTGECYTAPVHMVDFLVLRYNTDGSPDNSFDGDGLVGHDTAGGDDAGLAVGIQSDGKIDAAGLRYNGTDDDVGVERLNTDGSRDAGFGTGFGLIFDAGSVQGDSGWGVAIQSDGKIVVTGDTFSPPPPPAGGGGGGGCFIATVSNGVNKPKSPFLIFVSSITAIALVVRVREITRL
jgi:uncharacterized delta-60 repeat protein